MKKRIFVVAVCESETSGEAAESTQKVEQTEPLTGYTPENASGLTDFFQNLVPEDQCFYPTGAHAAGVLVYRNDIWSEDDAPKSFDDLSDPKYKDAVGMADPGVAAPAYPLAAYFMEQKRLEDGEAWFTSLFENGMKVYPKNPQVVKALSSGEISIINEPSVILLDEPLCNLDVQLRVEMRTEILVSVDGCSSHISVIGSHGREMTLRFRAEDCAFQRDPAEDALPAVCSPSEWSALRGL